MDNSQKLILPVGLALLCAIILFSFPKTTNLSSFSQNNSIAQDNQKPFPIPKISSDVESEMKLSDDVAKGFDVVINRVDINADEISEYFMLQRVPPHITKMYKTAGQFDSHTVFAREAIIIQNRADNTKTLLRLDQNGIQRAFNDVILETESAWGFAITVLSVNNQHYPEEVQIFNVTLLNPELEPVSDEITIYWHPVQKQYLATNTFGAPGTFD